MNALEIYRRLPRTNCGRCAQKTCLPFAVALAGGGAAPEECPDLDEETRGELGGVRGQGDWREALIADLQREVAALAFGEIAAGIGGELAGGALAIRCLGADYLVSPDGTVGPGAVSPWTRILLLHYVRTRGSAPLAGSWTSFGALRGGMMKASSFERDCEAPLRGLFEHDLAGAERALGRLDATREPGQPAPVAWRVPALPRVPLLVLFWPADEEFPAKLSVLFDPTADRFLDVESLLFLGEGLARGVESGPGTSPHD